MIEFSIDARLGPAVRQFVKAAQSVQKLKGGVNALTKATSKTARELEKTGGKARSTFGNKAVGDIKRYVTTVASIGTAFVVVRGIVKLVGDEIRNVIALQQQATLATLTLSAARKDVIRNLAGASRSEIAGVLKDITSISGETKVEERFIAKAFADAISASGGNRAASESAVRVAAKFLADKPEAIPAFAGSLLDISKITETTDADVNLGLLTRVGALSRVVKPAQQARNIPTALIGQKAFGATGPTAAALFASLTVASGDIEGERSGTAVISLTRQLRDLSRGEKAFKKGGARNIGDSALERIQALQANPELAREFLAKASFETKSVGQIERLLTDRQSPISRLFRQNLQKIPGNAELGAIGREAIANREIDPLESTSRITRTLDQAINRVETSRSSKGGAVRDRLRRLLLASGVSAVEAKLISAQFELATGFGEDGSVRVAEDILSDRASVLEQKKRLRPLFGDPKGRVRRQIPEFREPTEQESETAEIMREVAATLRDIRENTKQRSEPLRSPARQTQDLLDGNNAQVPPGGHRRQNVLP